MSQNETSSREIYKVISECHSACAYQVKWHLSSRKATQCLRPTVWCCSSSLAHHFLDYRDRGCIRTLCTEYNSIDIAIAGVSVQETSNDYSLLWSSAGRCWIEMELQVVVWKVRVFPMVCVLTARPGPNVFPPASPMYVMLRLMHKQVLRKDTDTLSCSLNKSNNLFIFLLFYYTATQRQG